MSEKDFDWSDDLDFESLAEEAEMTADYGEPADSFADFEDLADYAEAPEPGEAAAPAADAPKAAAVENPIPAASAAASVGGSTRLAGKPEKVVSPGGLGLLVAGSTVVGSLGLAGALLVAAGLKPAAMWDLSGLRSFDQIINFAEHPQNLFYLVALGVLLLAGLGASAAAGAARRANRRLHRSEGLLGRLTSLRLDDEAPWTSVEFKVDPDASAFVTDVVGAWRMLQARQVRSAGLEGELRRLEKALREDSRDDLGDRYDHPLVGSLADAMLAWHDDLHAARQEAREAREKDSADSASVMTLIEDARTWNQTNAQRVEVQGTTLRRWSGRFGDLAERFEKESGGQEAVAALQGLQKDLSRALQDGPQGDLASLDGLVDRGSKLAFQIAMEVARLGPRGERLLPMSQSLEELTTLFRQAVAKAKGGDEGPANPRAVLTRLEQITVSLVKDGPQGAGSLVRTLQDLVPASLKLAGNLEEVVGSFDQQGKRLNTLGTSFAEMTGLTFDADLVREGEPANPPEGGLTVSQSDPFGREQNRIPAPLSADVDPFGEAAAPSTVQAAGLTNRAQPADSDFQTDVTPGNENSFMVESFGTGESPAFGQDEDHDFDFERTPEFVAGEPELPAAEEKVYDLAEFGAVRIDQPGAAASADPDEDRIYDLVEFGAVALN